MAAMRVRPTGVWTERRLECCLPLSGSATPMIEAADSPETSLHVYQTQETALCEVLKLLACS
jgi:hypothetical protein